LCYIPFLFQFVAVILLTLWGKFDNLLFYIKLHFTGEVVRKGVEALLQVSPRAMGKEGGLSSIKKAERLNFASNVFQ
jgi:hypothetical protein